MNNAAANEDHPQKIVIAIEKGLQIDLWWFVKIFWSGSSYDYFLIVAATGQGLPYKVGTAELKKQKKTYVW